MEQLLSSPSAIAWCVIGSVVLYTFGFAIGWRAGHGEGSRRSWEQARRYFKPARDKNGKFVKERHD